MPTIDADPTDWPDWRKQLLKQPAAPAPAQQRPMGTTLNGPQPAANVMRLFRAGDAPRGAGAFYSTTEHGAAPYGWPGSPVTAHDVNVGQVFDAKQGDHYRLYKQFLQETGHPGGYGKNGLPFWTVEPELTKWLDDKGVPYNSIKFDENTGVPSMAVYRPQPIGR
jgi:hypothetical protein